MISCGLEHWKISSFPFHSLYKEHPSVIHFLCILQARLFIYIFTMRKLSLFTVFSLLSLLMFLLLLPILVSADKEEHCKSDDENQKKEESEKNEALKFKIGALVSILVFGALGVCLPILAKVVPAFRPENDVFFIVKAFAAGVILATGFIHILPEAFEKLTSSCFDPPWAEFPFTGFVAMVTAIGTLMVDTLATSYYERLHLSKATVSVNNDHDHDEERVTADSDHHGHVHSHRQHNALIASSDGTNSMDLIRHRVISQVLELGIIVHSVIIGIALGASSNPTEVKTLLIALSFHQFFEGIGLGGCISQAKFKSRSIIVMALFFALTTPAGIAIGIVITNGYHKNSPKALMVEGIFNAASAGILIYMALVDLLAADFMSPRLQSNARLQLGACVSLLLGAACMSVLGKWA